MYAGEIIDVMLIPDYQKILIRCVDPKLQNLHREAETQHQWLFDAVEPDMYFPFGCRTLYRAYCSDTVIEFFKKAPSQCVSKIGRYTGLEPVTVACKWYPSADCDPKRAGVEGMSILTDLPDIAVTSKIDPFPISIKAKTKLNAMLQEVLRRFRADVPEDLRVRKTWSLWCSKFAPESTCSLEYEKKLKDGGNKYPIPLRLLFFQRDSRFQADVLPAAEHERLNDDSIIWPEMRAMAMNSVTTSSNPCPPAPRLYLEDDLLWQENMTNFDVTTSEYYNTMVGRDFTAAVLKNILKTTLSFSCRIPTYSGIMFSLFDYILHAIYL